MRNFIESLQIENFKSVSKIKIDCKRINVLIGKPNVGKSNFLEALTLLGSNYSESNNFFSEFCRYENIGDLFYDHDVSKTINVLSNIVNASISFKENSDLYELIISDRIENLNLIDNAQSANENYNDVTKIINENENLVLIYYSLKPNGGIINTQNTNRFNLPVKKYTYRDNLTNDSKFNLFLKPPFGNNIHSVIRNNSALLDEFSDFFKEYDLEVVYINDEMKFKIQKRVDRVAYQYSYQSIADTFQRFIMHYAAIISNKDSIILFEEPESHEYPPFIRQLAQKIVEDKNNQYFITTHNPYLLNPLLEESEESEISLFHVYYEKHKTEVREMTKDEIADYLSYGQDLFFHLK